jgi:hypothetical protein
MTITMFDSVNADALPHNADAVAGYVDGVFVTFPELADRFPRAKRISIALHPGVDADVLDMEKGAATIADAPAWFKQQRARKLYKPRFYTSLSNIPELVQTLNDAGIHRSEYRIWSASWDNIPHIDEGCDATQYANEPAADVDKSLCWEDFFDTAPPKPSVNEWQPADEKRWCREWEALKGKNGPFAKVRRVALRGRMVAREVEIGRLAAISGWNIKNRAWRYKKLRSLVG